LLKNIIIFLRTRTRPEKTIFTGWRVEDFNRCKNENHPFFCACQRQKMALLNFKASPQIQRMVFEYF